LKHKTSLFIYCLHYCWQLKLLHIYINRGSRICSGVSLCFVNAGLSFYYFKILMKFTCKRRRAKIDLKWVFSNTKFM
jgi:hypothetical protein